MSQTKQLQKAKLYRGLKIAFYTLGLPLFFFAVICTAIKFIGEDPFVGMANASLSSGVFEGYERFITSPALYGIWCALAVWVFIVICHAIVSKTMKKNFRLRLFTMIAIVLVVMLGTMGIMDAAFTSKINKIAADAPEGVTVQDYKSQLSYYDYVSFGRKKKSLAYDLMDKVDRLETAYHIEYQGINKSGDAGNIGNKPVTYGRLLNEKGEAYAGTESSEKLVTIAPNKAGKLVVDGKEYPNYYYMSRKAGDGTEVTVWYDLDLVPLGYKWNAKKGKMEFNTTNGVYGEGLYNENGMLSDGWIFSFENMLEILEDIYEGQAMVDGANADGVRALQTKAAKLRRAYYEGTKELASKGGKVSDRVKAIYAGEDDLKADFSLTEAEISDLYSYIGQLLGDNALFDWLLQDPRGAATLGGLPIAAIQNLITDLKEGASLKGLLGSFGQAALMDTVCGIVTPLFSDKAPASGTISDLYIKLTYKDGEHPDNLFIEVFADNGENGIGNSLFDIDCTYDKDKFNSEFLNTRLQLLVDNLGLGELLDTIGGLAFTDMADGYKGIVVSGISIPLMKDGEFAIDVAKILSGVLETLYTYQSPVIKPVWEFYEDAAKELTSDDIVSATKTLTASDKIEILNAMKKVAPYLAMYERAYNEATVHGKLIGSVLYGDTIGTGAYTADAGLTDLASVRQLKMDLSYQPGNFPLYAFRDMLLISTGIVVCFYILYMIMAEKEKKYVAEALGEQTATDGDAESEKKPNAFVAGMRKFGQSIDSVCDKASAGVAKAADGFKKRTNWDDKKTAKVSKILTIVLYVVAFLPIVLIPLVLGAMSCHLLPSYSLWHFLGFIIALVFAAIFALVIVLISRKKSKVGKKGALARGWRIGLTYICLTTVFALLLTYLLPDLVAKGTSNTIYAEDIYYNSIQQVEKNTQLEHQYIIYNLLNGNLNRYEKDGNGNVKLAADGDFSYASLVKKDAYGTLLVKDIQEGFLNYVTKYDSMKKFQEYVDGLDSTKSELYNFVYQYYVLGDYYYAFKVGTGQPLQRRQIAMTITDYLYNHADYANLVKKGFKNAKLKQLFVENYDSFNQDGYKTFDDPLLLYAQMDGRMTVPAILQLILNKGWIYSQPNAEVNYETQNNFLYELYDPETYDAFVAAGHTFDKEGELVNGDGSVYKAKYGYNEQGWMVFENKIVKRPVNWLVLDMLGDPMDLASIQLPDALNLEGIPPLGIGDVLNMVGGNGLFEDALGGLLDADLRELVAKIANGATLRIGAYIDDNMQLKLQLLPMNSYFGMLGYMQASWVQSNNLIMAIVNIESMRNGLLIMSGIGLVLILLATLLSEAGRNAQARLAEQSESEEQGEAEAEPDAEPAPAPEEA